MVVVVALLHDRVERSVHHQCPCDQRGSGPRYRVRSGNGTSQGRCGRLHGNTKDGGERIERHYYGRPVSAGERQGHLHPVLHALPRCGCRGIRTWVGPNLTDAYWLHGGDVKDVFKTVKYGVPVERDDQLESADQTDGDRGRGELHPKFERDRVVLLKKAPQGELWKEGTNDVVPTDSITTKADTALGQQLMAPQPQHIKRDESYRDSISTVDKDGKRVWVYPKKPSGKVHAVAPMVRLWVIGPVVRRSVHSHRRRTTVDDQLGGTPLCLLRSGVLAQDFLIFVVGC